jgi:hypothetical protein
VSDAIKTLKLESRVCCTLSVQCTMGTAEEFLFSKAETNVKENTPAPPPPAFLLLLAENLNVLR